MSVVVDSQQLLIILANHPGREWHLSHLHMRLNLAPQSFFPTTLPKHQQYTLLIFYTIHNLSINQLSPLDMQQSSQLLTIFHFNDVYNMQPYTTEPKAGAAYFQALLQREKKKYQHPLTLFSGDAFSPALLSSEFDGQNMIKPLNSLGIDLACFGNHDLDYELEHVMELIGKTNFPWLLSNVYDKRTQRRLAEGLETYIFQKNGVKIGVFSLAEKQWIDTLYPSYKQICEYIPFIDFAERMVYKLREEQKCDMIIALTHMMKYNDIKLANTVKGIDLILGGHDHLIVHEKIGDSMLVKSGTDFKNFSIIRVQKNTTGEVPESSKYVKGEMTRNFGNKWWLFEIQLKEVNHQLENIQPDPELNQYIEDIYKEFKIKMEKVALFTLKPMDLRFKVIRKEQSPFLQFLASVYRHQSEADIAMMNSGNFRMDTKIQPGPITFGVIENIILDTIIVKIVPGPVLIQALENCVSMYPNLAGRYSAFSGIGFTWDASKKPGERVLHETVKIHEKPIDLNRDYKVAVHSFAGAGGDGFECLKGCQTLQNDGDKTNFQLVHDIFHVNHFLLDSYVPKYPNRFKIIQYQGHPCLQLDLPEPKNVKMIMSTGHAYEGH